MVEARSGRRRATGSSRPGRLAAAAGTAGVVLAAVPFASAECTANHLYPGTVYYDNVLTAQSQNATVFGASRTLDREVMPHLRKQTDKDDFAFSIFYGWSTTQNAARVPARMSGCGNDGLGWLPYDLHSYNMAFAFRFDKLSVFYSAAGTGGAFVADSGDRLWAGGLSWVGSFFYSYLAPLVGSNTVSMTGPNHAAAGGKKYNQLRMDYTVGLEYDFARLNVRAGYLGSKGIYTNLDAPDLRLYATTVFNESFSNFAYLSAGFYSLRSLAKDLQDKAGMTSIYGRKVQSLGVSRTDLTADVIEPAIKTFDFWTGHLDHKDIRKMVDLGVAAGVYPKPGFHEGRIVLHTANYNWEARLMDRSWRGDHQATDFSGGIQVGMVNLPSLPYYAREGGQVVSLSAEGRVFVNAAVFRILARYNDPDLLAVFPYAKGAWQFGIHLNVVKR